MFSEALEKTDTQEIDTLLCAWNAGDRDALDRLMPLVIEELHFMARNRFGREGSGHTLQPTAVVNECYLRMSGARKPPRTRGHFLALAAVTIKHILYDHARRKSAIKRGDHVYLEELQEAILGVGNHKVMEDLLGLEQALEQLEQSEPELSRIVHLRFFLGLTYEEIGELFGKSQKWVRRHWELARALLLVSLERGQVV